MNIFKNKKKLEQERLERLRVQNENDELRRQQEYQDSLRTQEQEQRIAERERLRQSQQALDDKLKEMQQQEEAAKKRVKDRERMELERQMEDERLNTEWKENLKQASPETLRDMRDLIRERFELDVRIWELRGARRPDRPIVENKMKKADAVMEDILYMTQLWGDNSDGRWKAEEWEKVQIIRKKLHEGGYRKWEGKPPWEERA